MPRHIIHGAIHRGSIPSVVVVLTEPQEFADRYQLPGDGKRAPDSTAVQGPPVIPPPFGRRRSHLKLDRTGNHHHRLPLPVDVPLAMRLVLALRQLLTDVFESLLSPRLVLR